MLDGFWERIIKDIERCVKKAIGRALLNDNELVMHEFEIMSVLNSKPLCHMYEDHDGISYP